MRKHTHKPQRSMTGTSVTAKNKANTTQSDFSTHSMILMALFAALLCISAYLNIPLPTGGHITLQTFMVLLIAFLFPLKQSAGILCLYLLLGSIGLPVFAGGVGGISYLVSSLGGYSISFIIIAVLLPLLRTEEYRRIRYTLLSLLAAVFIDLFGCLWLMALGALSLKQALLLGFLPFLPLDLVKAVLVAQVVPSFQKIIQLNSY